MNQWDRINIECSDLTTPIVSSADPVNGFRMPGAFRLTDVRASLLGAAGSGTFTVDVHVGGSTIFATKLTIDAGETTSKSAAARYVFVAPFAGQRPGFHFVDIADDAAVEVFVDDDAAGDALGLNVYLMGWWVI